MQSSEPGVHRSNSFSKRGWAGFLSLLVAAWWAAPAGHAQGTTAATNNAGESISGPTDPVLNLLLEKGMITEDEAAKTQAQADALRTNMAAQYALEDSKWKIGKDIKDMEIFGDLRLRYEGRRETAPDGGRINLDRFRYAFRVGIRGDVIDDFYYGFRLETSSNPRSSWVTMGTSSSGAPYSGPYGKSTAGIDIGQLYLGWKLDSWLELTVGKMPNPLDTSSLVWSPSINPEGLAEHLKYTVGPVDFFGNFAQFLYQDENPDNATTGLGIGGLSGQNANNIILVAWQGGLNVHFTTNFSAKAAAGIYKYYGMERGTIKAPGISPYFGDPYVGEGAYTGPNTANPYNGYSGYTTAQSTLPNLYNYESLGYPNNQVGLDYLSVLEFPFEINYRFKKVDVRAFGDIAYNIQGAQRARAAAAGYVAYLNYEHLGNSAVNVKALSFPAQTHDVKAYQFGLSVAAKDCIGLVNGSVSKKYGWEGKAYWQHIEQYSLDPNLLDLDYMAGAENLEGIYGAVAYGFNDNFTATVRYGYASRINHILGTGGTGTDIPNINPINYFSLLQVDLAFKF